MYVSANKCNMFVGKVELYSSGWHSCASGTCAVVGTFLDVKQGKAMIVPLRWSCIALSPELENCLNF